MSRGGLPVMSPEEITVMFFIGVGSHIIAGFYPSFIEGMIAYCLSVAVLSVVTFGLLNEMEKVMK